MLLTQIARSLGLQQKFDEAEAVLDQAQTLLADSPPSARIERQGAPACREPARLPAAGSDLCITTSLGEGRGRRAGGSALELFGRALKFRLKQGNPANIAMAGWCEAKVLRRLGRVDEAYGIQLELLAQKNASDPDGYVYEELAECLLALGRPDDAADYFAAAYSVLSQDRWFSETGRLERMRRLSLAKPKKTSRRDASLDAPAGWS
ncbi:hypothetical protein ACLBWT_02855 [Paenibacillus sp. D51F]